MLALRVKAGDRVAAASRWVRIDDRDSRAGVARSDAAVTQAEAEARNAEVALNRSRDLKKSGLSAKPPSTTPRRSIQAARAALDRRAARRPGLTVAQGNAEVVAPYDAVVSATHGRLPGSRPARARAGDAFRTRPHARRGAGAGLARRSGGRRPTSPCNWPTAARGSPTARELLPAADPVSQTVEWPRPARREQPPARADRRCACWRRGAHFQAGRRQRATPARRRRCCAPRRADRRLRGAERRASCCARYASAGRGRPRRGARGPAAGERVAVDPVRAGLQNAARRGSEAHAMNVASLGGRWVVSPHLPAPCADAAAEEEPQINVTMANVLIPFPGAPARMCSPWWRGRPSRCWADRRHRAHLFGVAPGMAVITVQFKVGVPRTEALVRLYDTCSTPTRTGCPPSSACCRHGQAKGHRRRAGAGGDAVDRVRQNEHPPSSSAWRTMEAELKRVPACARSPRSAGPAAR